MSRFSKTTLAQEIADAMYRLEQEYHFDITRGHYQCERIAKARRMDQTDVHRAYGEYDALNEIWTRHELWKHLPASEAA